MITKIKKRFKRCLISVLVVLATLCIFISSSVVTFASGLDESVFRFHIAKPTVSPQNAYVEVVYKNVYGIFCEVIMVAFDSPNGNLCLDIYDTYLNIYCLESGVEISAFWLSTSGSSGFYNTHGGTIQEGGFSTILEVRPYGFSAIHTFGATNTNSAYNIIYGVDGLAYSELRQIEGLLQGIYNNTLSQDAIEQQTQQIIQNQQQQTDKILNGGHDTPQYDDYESNSTITGTEEKEQQAQDNASQGVDHYNELGNTVHNLFDYDSGIFRGVSAMSYVVGQVIGESWVNSLLIIALYIGLFAFVVNAVSMVVNFARQRSKNKNP